MKNYRLKDLCIKITDGSHNPPQGTNISEFMMLSSKNILNDRITYEEPRFLTEEEFKSENRRTDIQVGDVLLTIVGTVGRCAVYCLPEKVVLQRSVAVLKPKKNLVEPRFLMYRLINLRKYFEEESRGVAQKGIYLKKLADTEIDIPGLENQNKVVQILDTAKLLIDKRKQQIEESEELIKSRFVEMFGDPFINTKQWDVLPLKDIIVNANNGLARRGKANKGGIVLRLIELRDGYINYTNVNRIELTDKEREKYLLEDNDFLFARVNGNPDYVGRCAVFKVVDEQVYHNDHIIRVHFDEKILEGHFTSCLLNSDYGKKELRSQIKTSAGQYTVSQDGIGAIKVIIPPIDLQNQFAAFVQAIDKLKFALQKSLQEMEDNFNVLMQKAFNGELFTED